eukprot:889474-Rhodomonas_salina.1
MVAAIASSTPPWGTCQVPAQVNAGTQQGKPRLEPTHAPTQGQCCPVFVSNSGFPSLRFALFS